MSLYDDTCDTCGTFIDPIGGDYAITGIALGMDDPELLFCCPACAEDYDIPVVSNGCEFCGALDHEEHDPGCYFYEDDADSS